MARKQEKWRDEDLLACWFANHAMFTRGVNMETMSMSGVREQHRRSLETLGNQPSRAELNALLAE